MAKLKAKSPYPQIGLGGAGFALLLVILAAAERSSDESRALEWLSIGIPLAITSAFITYLRGINGDGRSIYPILFLAETLASGVGDIACLGGIYFAIRSASPNAAHNFLVISIAAYIIVSLGEMGLRIYYSKKKTQTEEAVPPDETAYGDSEVMARLRPSQTVERTDAALSRDSAVAKDR